MNLLNEWHGVGGAGVLSTKATLLSGCCVVLSLWRWSKIETHDT